MTTRQQKDTGYRAGGDTAIFYNGPALATFPAVGDEQAPSEYYLIKITTSGGDSPDGTVHIEGTYEGSPEDENILIDGNGVDYGISAYSPGTVPTLMTSSGLADESPVSNLIIQPVDTMYLQPLAGGPVPFSMDWHDETVFVRDAEGDQVRFDHWYICDEEFEVGDSITYQEVVYTVQRVLAVKLMSRKVDHFKVWV